MKSKFPFAMKSPLLAYKSDMKGAYANPRYVKEEIVGVKIGEALTKAGTDIFSSLTAPDKTDSSGTIATHGLGGGEYKGFGGGMREINLPEIPDVNTNLTNPNDFSRFTGSEVPDLVSKSKKVSGSNLPTYAEAYKNDIDGVRTEKGYKNFNAYLEDMKEIKKGDNRDIEREAARTKAINGSPVKHNTEAAGAIGSDFSQAKNKYADIFGKPATAVGQNKQSGVGIIQSFITRAKNQGGSMAGSIGQQIGNQAQQGAADAGGSTGVDSFLPPPNQVAETGSYGGGGDRILEMDSNPVGNQSIGRNTDITSQLFGSGQRASMLAMKGTPLHTEGHGGAKGHTHAKPGDYLDQTVAENMGVNDIENYKPIQRFKGKQIVVNSKKKDTIFSQGSTFVNPKQMEGITLSSEGTPPYEPVYINKKSK